MDSRIEAVKTAIISELMTNWQGDKSRRLVLELHDVSDGGGYCLSSVESIVDRALSLLTAEPEPCEDTRELASQVIMIYCNAAKSALMNDITNDIAQRIDTYASRLVQEAMDDERIRDGKIAHDEIIEYDDDLVGLANRVESAILKGTEPAKGCDSDSVIPIPVVGQFRARLGRPTPLDPPNYEPAKVGEDVEGDIETVRDAIMAGQYRIDDGDDTHKALAALDRLASRLKEGR